MGNSCNSFLTKPCLSESDKRYDPDFPTTIIGQDPRWKKMGRFFKVNITVFNPIAGETFQPSPYIAGVSDRLAFTNDREIAFYNHTFDGSRFIANRYYFKPPAPEAWCKIPFPAPMMNAPPGTTCGVNGFSDIAGAYASLNHEHDGTLTIARVTGAYALSSTSTEPGISEAGLGSMAKVTDDNTFELTFVVGQQFSSVQSMVFFDDDNAALSTVQTAQSIKRIWSTLTGTVVRINEEEFLAGINEYNTAFNVTDPIQAPMTSNEVPRYAGTFPSEDQWCGGLISDVSCTPSPYQEPDAQLKGGFVALFVVLGVLVFGIGAFLLHQDSAKKQKRRYKEHFVRGIAQNITIADDAGRVSPEQLKKEFDHIDNDKGGTITKDELKAFLASGKVGEISDKDVEAMWYAIDIDNSGEVDFVEFMTFLGTCGTEFEEINKEQKAMTREQKLMNASRRLSTKTLSIVADIKDKGNDNEEDA